MTDRLPGSPVDRLRSLLAAATPGPWNACGARDGICGLVWSTPADVPVATTAASDDFGISATKEITLANGDLIAEGITALPLLLDVAEAAQEATLDGHNGCGPCMSVLSAALAALEAGAGQEEAG